MTNSPTVLNVAEKPSVARSLASVFGRMPGARDRGMRREANQVFTHENVCFPNVYAQGEGRQIQGPISPHTMITTSVRGHLASNDFPAEYGWSKCDPSQLFDAPIDTLYRRDMEPLERMLRQLSSRCQVLILWLDCDREGEAIGDEVRTVCLNGNPRLAVFRARFSTVLPQEIQRALKSLGRLNENFVAAVQARSELDLRVGAAFTRFQTLRLQRKFDAIAEQGVVSYGPCQFPTLGFVVERWARIETFVPENFWYLELSLRPQVTQSAEEDGEISTRPQRNNNTSREIAFRWKRGVLYDRVSTLVFYEMCLDAGEAVVTQMSGRPKNKWRPVPLATVELQKRASRYLRIGSETLMTAAEELYQQGYISYPRTETEKFRPEFHHRSLIEQLSTIPGDLGGYSTKLLQDNGFQMPRAGRNDDQAHPPITPCKAVDPNTINDANQRNVYILVVKHYLACCSRDAVGKETTITVKVASEEFNASGLMVLEKNWLEVYEPWERWSTGQGELPRLEVGSRITPSSLIMKEGRSTPPQPITEVELISLMDRNGIGTDATIAQHITTIQEREYATKDASQKFHPTKLGIALVEGYNSMGYQLNKPDLRRETESLCNMIASGNTTKDEVMTTLLARMRQCFQTVSQEAQKLDEAVGRHFSRLGTSNNNTQVLQANFSLCGVCNNPMALKQERNARGGRNNTNAVRKKLLFCEVCQAGWNLPRGNPTPKVQENGGGAVECPICNFQAIRILRGDGYTGDGYHVCPKCFSDPPAEHGGNAGGGDFRCFSCQHPTCALASGVSGAETEAFACPFCPPNNANSSKIVLKKTSRGYILSCNKYIPGQDRCPYTIWLPKECETVSVQAGDENSHNGICVYCSQNGRVVRQLTFAFKRGSLPDHYGAGLTTCVLCDVQLRQDLRITLPQRNQVVARPAVRRTTTATGRGNGGGRGRSGGRGRGRGRSGGRGRGRGATQGNQCYRCGQSGHFANNCPNR